MTDRFDLVVIGAGSGGVRAARMAAGFGARVAVVEDRYWGGTCVNVGCVPKKLYVYASGYREHFRDAAGFGWSVDEPVFDWEMLKTNRRNEISRLNAIYRKILDDAGVTQFEARGHLADANTVVLSDGRILHANKILVATGGWPFIPDIPGNDYAITSNEVFDLPRFPQSIAVVGGGYIAVEFASIFDGLGAESHLIYRRDKVLRYFDQDVSSVLTEELKTRGIHLHLEDNVRSVERLQSGKLAVQLGGREVLHVDAILYATGRQPNVAGLGVENTAVVLNDDGAIVVDEYYRTAEPSIFALGDVIGGPALTPVALAEAMVFARQWFGEGSEPLDYAQVPTAVFSQPDVAAVGLTEAAARARYHNTVIYKTRFRHLRHTLSGNPTRIFMKLVVDGDTDRVVGIHMVGEEAAEIIQGLAVALKAGVTKRVLDSTIGIHPTAAEEFVTMREPAH